MNCKHCGARAEEGEGRCPRCGRRPDDSLNGVLLAPRSKSALATKLQAQAAEDSAEIVSARGAVQRSLFSSNPSPKVVSISDVGQAPRPARDPQVAPPRHASSPPKRATRPATAQTSLPFLPTAPPKPRTLSTTVDAVIFCDEPVAPKAHRAVAGALDWSVVALGYAAFLAVIRIGCGPIQLTKTNAAVFMGMLFVVGMAYGLICTIAGSETPGMRWTQLHITTFEGFAPDRKHRWMRLAGSCLSFCTLAGLLWIFADEEGLTWQDHISRTFPTPRRWGSRVIARC